MSARLRRCPRPNPRPPDLRRSRRRWCARGRRACDRPAGGARCHRHRCRSRSRRRSGARRQVCAAGPRSRGVRATRSRRARALGSRLLCGWRRRHDPRAAASDGTRRPRRCPQDRADRVRHAGWYGSTAGGVPEAARGSGTAVRRPRRRTDGNARGPRDRRKCHLAPRAAWLYQRTHRARGPRPLWGQTLNAETRSRSAS